MGTAVLIADAPEGQVPHYVFRSWGKGYGGRQFTPRVESVVTVAGKVTGAKTMKLGELEYRYPCIKIEEIHLWKEKKPPSYYDPYPWYPMGGPWGYWGPWAPYYPIGGW